MSITKQNTRPSLAPRWVCGEGHLKDRSRKCISEEPIRHFEFRNDLNAGSCHLHVWLIRDMAFGMAHIKMRKNTGADRIPGLARRTTHQGCCGKKRQPWRGMKESIEEETGQMDGGLQGDPTRGRRKRRGCCRSPEQQVYMGWFILLD